MALEMKSKNLDEYQELVRRLFCEELDIECEESLFLYEPDTPVDEKCRGCLPSRKKDVSKKDECNPWVIDNNISAINQLIQFLSLDRNVREEGIFRKSGSLRKQQELKERLTDDDGIKLEEEEYSAHECATVLKSLLSNLNQPLVTDSCYKAHLQVTLLQSRGTSDDEITSIVLKQIVCTQLLFQLISEDYFNILKDVLLLLNSVIKCESENKMSSFNLGTLFSTHILSPKKMSPETLQTNMKLFTAATAFMIENAPILFAIPEKLEKEVQCFNFARGSESRRSLALKSKEAPGVASLVANTVFTFIRNDVDDDHKANGNKHDVMENVNVCDNTENTVMTLMDGNLNILNNA